MASGAVLPRSPRFLADVNFNLRILAGLKRRASSCDIVTAQELGLDTILDPDLLAEARNLDRIVLTHDVNTMPAHFKAFILTGVDVAPSPGVIALPQGIAVGVAIDALHEFWACSAHDEWRNQLVFLPFSSPKSRA
jgi:hypothetical protein